MFTTSSLKFAMRTGAALLVSAFLLFAINAAQASVSAASAQEEACKALGETWDAGNSTCGSGEAKLNSTIDNVVNILSVIVGIIAVIMIIYAGFMYITAAGETSKLTTARHALVYAIVGIVIVALAQIIVRFVLGQTAV